MDVTEFLTGNYLTAAEVKVPTNVTVADTKRELVGSGQDQKTRLVVYFTELQKGMVANKTNLGVIASLFGTDSDAWKGQPLQLFTEMVNFQGRQVLGLRVRTVPQPPPGPSEPASQPAMVQPTGPEPQGVAAQPQPATDQPAQAQPGAAPWEVADQQPQQ